MTVVDGEPLRCFCRGKPILAVMKLDNRKKPFVHIKVYKASRIYAEIVFSRGDMRVRCRECYRWHQIRIVHERAVLEDVPDEEDLVDLIEDPA